MQNLLTIALVTVLLCRPGVAIGQEDGVPIGGEVEHYLRLLEIEGKAIGPLTFHSFSTSAQWQITDSTHPWAVRYGIPVPPPAQRLRLQFVPGLIHVVFNSDHPFGGNDGALWAGRGLNADATVGVRLAWGPLTAVLLPVFTFSQNRDFEIRQPVIAGFSPYTNRWHTGHIDWPQRFGPNALSAIDPGQSSLRFARGAFTAAISTENMWWGPASQYPLLMSNTAPGFIHSDIGLGRPINIGIGALEARVIWGRLTESAFFDTVSDNNYRFLAAVTGALHLRWPEGLVLGFHRVFYQRWDDSLRLGDWLTIVQPFFKDAFMTPTNRSGEDQRDQLLSLSARWIMPAADFEFYLEYARNDHAVNLRDLILEPDHSRAFAIGFQKAFPSAGHTTRLSAEWADLGHTLTEEVRADPTFYVHDYVRQGYTQKGQLLGAWIGPGSNAQYLGVDRYDDMGRVGVFLQRYLYDNDAYYPLAAKDGNFWGHDVELTLGLAAARFTEHLDLGVTLQISRELNRYFIRDTNTTQLTVSFSVQQTRPVRGRH